MKEFEAGAIEVAEGDKAVVAEGAGEPGAAEVDGVVEVQRVSGAVVVGDGGEELDVLV